MKGEIIMTMQRMPTLVALLVLTLLANPGVWAPSEAWGETNSGDFFARLTIEWSLLELHSYSPYSL